MVYTELKKLAVIKLKKGVDSISFDILERAMCDRATNVIYCELEQKLYGIISMGDIVRASKKGFNYASINKKFVNILNGEYMKARRIFHEYKNINALPVLDSSGMLLGEYTRWDDFFYQINAQISKYPFICSDFIILVQPCSLFEKKQELFRCFYKYLLSKNVSVKCIMNNEIINYLDYSDWILFVDEDELRCADTFYLHILNQNLGKTKFSTYKMFMNNTKYDISYKVMNTYLKNINDNGVYVLNLIFEQNAKNNVYFETLNKEIQMKYDADNEEAVNRVYPSQYQGFFDDLYTEEYAESITQIKYSVETISGFKMLKDCHSEFYNVINGERYTYGQPKEYDKVIYFVGPCYMYGHHTEDRYTIESFLQKQLNETGYRIKVVNCGSVYNAENKCYAWIRIKSLPLRKGDIVVYGGWKFDDTDKLNLLDVCEEHNISARWMTNAPQHCNHKLNELYADAIYHALRPVLPKTVDGYGTLIQNNEDFIKTTYIDRYFKDFELSMYKKIGSIVMNCNPFTFGHRYLIEQALNIVDFLIIFVVEEDKSLFSFTERFAMVCDGVADLDNVKVVPSGPFILSQTTFPEYFIKEADEDIVENVENDITLFAERIATHLNIKYRFVGEEPEDIVTNEYNLAMKRILPKNNIKLIEIPRKKIGNKNISASLVRKYIEDCDMDRLGQLIPETTKKILYAIND